MVSKSAILVKIFLRAEPEAQMEMLTLSGEVQG